MTHGATCECWGRLAGRDGGALALHRYCRGGGTRPCVTVGEYRAINPHTGGSAGTRAQIKAAFGTGGTVYRQTEYESAGVTQRVQWRKYDRCGSERVYRIEYHQFGSRPYVSYWG